MRTTIGLLALALVASACGDLQRDNPFDPVVNGGISLRDQLLGAWSRVDEEANEIYTFAADGRVELREFASTTGAAVDRNAPFPATRVRVYTGTYQLTSNLLSIYFTQAQSNDPDDSVRVPATERVAEITIRRNTLTFSESDGTRFYTQLGGS